MTIKNCSNCGGTHYGSIKCPYIKAPCVICGEETIEACADCSIDSAGKEHPHVCEKATCRDEHEKSHKATPPPATGCAACSTGNTPCDGWHFGANPDNPIPCTRTATTDREK